MGVCACAVSCVLKEIASLIITSVKESLIVEKIKREVSDETEKIIRYVCEL